MQPSCTFRERISSRETSFFTKEIGGRTRGNDFKIKRQRFRLDIKKNGLPRNNVVALSPEVFQARFNEALGSMM